MKNKIIIGLLVVGTIGVGAKGVNALTHNKENLVHNYEVQRTLVETPIDDGTTTNGQNDVVLNQTNHEVNHDGINHQNHDNLNHNSNHSNHNGTHR